MAIPPISRPASTSVDVGNERRHPLRDVLEQDRVGLEPVLVEVLGRDAS